MFQQDTVLQSTILGPARDLSSSKGSQSAIDENKPADIPDFEAAVSAVLVSAEGIFGDSLVSSPTDGFTPSRGGWTSFQPLEGFCISPIFAID